MQKEEKRTQRKQRKLSWSRTQVFPNPNRQELHYFQLVCYQKKKFCIVVSVHSSDRLIACLHKLWGYNSGALTNTCDAVVLFLLFALNILIFGSGVYLIIVCCTFRLRFETPQRTEMSESRYMDGFTDYVDRVKTSFSSCCETELASCSVYWQTKW